jgi:cell division septation protein DedD
MGKKRSSSEKRSRKYQIELTPLSIFLWGGCFFFVLAWIFVLGILVGRGFLPGAVTALSDLKNQIGVLQQMVSREKSQDLDPPKKSDSDPKLAFYDKLSSKKMEIPKETEPRRRPKKSTTKKTNAMEPNSSQEFSPKRESSGAHIAAGQNQVETSKVASPERKERVEPSVPKAKYTVQLASLDEKRKAEKLIGDLAQRGFPAYCYEAKVKGKTYYRVRCGTFPSRKAAEDYARKLGKEAGIKGFVSRIE